MQILRSEIPSTFSEKTVDVRPITGRIGAEVRNVRLSELEDDALEEVSRALLHHKVLFFRNQADLSVEGHEQFAAKFGTPEAHPTISVASGSRFVLELDSARGGRANNWHTDITFMTRPYKASILRAVVAPEIGGDTVWANTAAAYADLPDTLRKMADELWAQHSNAFDYAEQTGNAQKGAQALTANELTKTIHCTEHPVVHVHPETGERALLLGAFFRRFVGIPQRESQYLYDLLQGYITRLENTVRWRWAPGDVVIWDNRATQHYAIDDYGEQARVVHRVSVQGEIPCSVDGRSSRAIPS
ncbi:MAG: TauD/TfdA family dioxygenase [Hyphomicrobiales bacterium]|nr:MAG: TauD/TfdA family dioxygenase [Hyphomicrobiales bacterium]